MKKQHWLMIILLCLSLSGCWNLYAGQRPDELGPAIWKSDNPDIWFEVYETDPELGYVEPKGQLVYKGVTHSFIVLFNNADGVVFQSSDGEDGLFMANCRFGTKKLVVIIIPKSDYIFNGTVQEITFIKYNKDDE
jgi:hypothetical protein